MASSIFSVRERADAIPRRLGARARHQSRQEIAGVARDGQGDAVGQHGHHRGLHDRLGAARPAQRDGECSVQRHALRRRQAQRAEGEVVAVLVAQLLFAHELGDERRRPGALHVHGWQRVYNPRRNFDALAALVSVPSRSVGL